MRQDQVGELWDSERLPIGFEGIWAALERLQLSLWHGGSNCVTRIHSSALKTFLSGILVKEIQ